MHATVASQVLHQPPCDFGPTTRLAHHRHETPDDAAEAGVVTAAMMARGRTRPLRTRRSGAAGTYCLELRPLLVAQLAVEIVEGRAHAFDGLQHDVESFADRFKPRWRRDGITRLARGAQHIRRLGGGVLQGRETCALRFGWMDPGIDFGGWPTRHAALGDAAILADRIAAVLCGLDVALILAKPIQPRLLLLVEEIIETLQGRLNNIHRRYHRLDPSLHPRDAVG